MALNPFETTEYLIDKASLEQLVNKNEFAQFQICPTARS